MSIMLYKEYIKVWFHNNISMSLIERTVKSPGSGLPRRMTGTSLIESPHGVRATFRSEMAAPRNGDCAEPTKQSIADRLGLERVDVKAVLGKKAREKERAEKSMKWFYRSIIAGGICGLSLAINTFIDGAGQNVLGYIGMVALGMTGITSWMSSRPYKINLSDVLSRTMGSAGAVITGIRAAELFFITDSQMRRNSMANSLIGLGLMAAAIVMAEISHRKRMSDLEKTENQ